MKKILVFGTFDGLHPGHLNFLQQAAKLGQVFVVVARDANVVHIKARKSHFSERSRLLKVAKVPNVFYARLGSQENFLQPIIEIEPDIIALGFDQKTFTPNELKTKLRKINLAPKIIRLKSFQPEKYKSSLLPKK